MSQQLFDIDSAANDESDEVRLTDEQKKIQASWSSQLNNIPKALKEAALKSCWRIYDQVFAQQTATVRDDHIAKDVVEKSMAQSTAIATVGFIVFQPLHLISEQEMPYAIEILSADPMKFHEWMQEKTKDAPSILIMGDFPDQDHIHKTLDGYLSQKGAARLVVGPGHEMEAIIRSYAEERGYMRSAIQSVDIHMSGNCWRQLPGDKLDVTISNLYSFNPTHALAFEPMRSPSTLQVMQEAHRRGLEVTLAEAPAAQPKIKLAA